MASRKQKLIDYNRSVILEAARGLFLTGGLDGVSADEIAAEAECSKATVYAYFRSKEEIYYTIAAEHMNSLRDGIRECLSGTSDFERAYFTMCNMLARFEKDYPRYFDCVQGKLPTDSEKIAELPVLKTIFDRGEEINTIICEFIGRAKTGGFVRSDVDPIQATFVLWSSICGIISLCSDKKEYLEDSLGFTRGGFLKNGFELILQSIKNN